MVLAAVVGLNVYHRAKPHTVDNDGAPGQESPVSVWAVRESAAYIAEILESLGKPDPILEYYRDEDSHDEIEAFFSAIVQSKEIAGVILTNAEIFDISPSLAFALCWGESRFNPLAVNRENRNQTTDRGLFQLNGASFPKLTEDDFFNPAVNAYYGMAHLRWCLDVGGSVVAGLAMYNAGTNRVNGGATPRHTLDHVSRILEFRNGIETLFQEEYIKREPQAQREIVISKTPR
jgi:hypothetical protein